MTTLNMPAAKSAAVQLRYFLKERGFDVPLSLAQEALARTRGAASFQVLLAAEKKPPPVPAQPANLTLEFTWGVRLLNEELLDEALAEYELGSDRMPLEDKVGAVCVEQNRDYDFLKHGGPLVTVRRAPEAMGADVFLVTVRTTVTDEPALRSFTARCVARAWGACDELPESTVDCLFEALCASNSRASPLELGFEYLGQIPDQPTPSTSI